MRDSAKIATSGKRFRVQRREYKIIFSITENLCIMIVVSVHDGAVMVFCFYSFFLFVKYTKDWETTNLYHSYNALLCVTYTLLLEYWTK